MKQEIKTSIDNVITELTAKTDFELRKSIYSVGIISAHWAVQLINPDDEDYKEVYQYIYDNLHNLDVRINEGTSVFKITAEFTSRGQKHIWESSFTERTYEEAIIRFAEKIKFEYRITRNIFYQLTTNEHETAN